ncbi:MAG: hypothetical protein V1769_00835 [Thermoplasmatota archaeon]
MNGIEDDPIIGHLFDTAEKKARWIVRLKIAYILWIVMVIIGFFTFLLWYLFK